MDEEVKYISLNIAAKNCDYSQEYLSLRARQGKLKSVKFGRNWFTTESWLLEYLEQFGSLGVDKIINHGAFLGTDHFIINKRNFLIPPEIVQEASVKNDSPLNKYKLFFYKTAKFPVAVVSVILAVFFLGIILSSSHNNYDWLLENVKASASSVWDRLGKTTEITAENTAIIRADIEGKNYECKCDFIIR